MIKVNLLDTQYGVRISEDTFRFRALASSFPVHPDRIDRVVFVLDVIGGVLGDSNMSYRRKVGSREFAD